MMTILTKQEAYKLDRKTIESGHLSNDKLIDNAGKTVSDFFLNNIKNSIKQKVLIVCGKGNNGGDGVVAHYYLKKNKINSSIMFCEKNIHGDLLRRYNISKNDYCYYNKNFDFTSYNWIIDAIFGIGFSRDLTKNYIELINLINENPNILSIDIPSAINANSSKKYDTFIKAKCTITFGYSKLGHYVNCIDNLHIKNIGFVIVNKLSSYNLIDINDVNKILKPYINKKEIHKFDRGDLCIVGGSLHFPGAAILAAKASIKSGAGFVRLHLVDTYVDKTSTPEKWNEYYSLLSSIKSMYPDIIVNPYQHADLPEDTCNNILFGPGINWRTAPEAIIKKKYINIIVDASGFNTFESINDYPENTILTPHIGEFKKIFHIGNDFELNDLLFSKIQKEIKDKIIILKSFNTFIITKDEVYIIDKGPSILAVAGTGDVLSGILISLLSQGYNRLEASILGTYLHAESANYYRDNISKDGMTASDLIKYIPQAYTKLRSLKDSDG